MPETSTRCSAASKSTIPLQSVSKRTLTYFLFLTIFFVSALNLLSLPLESSDLEVDFRGMYIYHIVVLSMQVKNRLVYKTHSYCVQLLSSMKWGSKCLLILLRFIVLKDPPSTVYRGSAHCIFHIK